MSEQKAREHILEIILTTEIKQELEAIAQAKSISLDTLMHDMIEDYLTPTSDTTLSLHVSSDNMEDLKDLIEGGKYLLEMYKT